MNFFPNKPLLDKVCLYDNVPSALLVYITPDDADDYGKYLIEGYAEGGGYFLEAEREAS